MSRARFGVRGRMLSAAFFLAAVLPALWGDGAAWFGAAAATPAAATPAAPSPDPGPDPGAPPMHKAAAAGDIALMERLFLEGEGLGRADSGGRTPLHAAAAAAQDAAVEWLIAHEAGVTTKDVGGRTAADLASEAGHRRTSIIIKKFILLVSIEQAAAHQSDWAGLADALTRDARRYSLLHVLAMTGVVEQAREELKAGAAVDARTVLGATPLMKAAFAGHAAMVKLLVDSGADVNAKDLLGNTALIAAVVSGKEDIVSLLLGAGADLRPRSVNGGGTALELAERMGKTKVAELLRNAEKAR